MSDRTESLRRESDWSDVRVVVAGFGISGYAAADNLTFLGARVTALDDSVAGDRTERARLLESLGATIRLGPGSTASLPDDVDPLAVSVLARAQRLGRVLELAMADAPGAAVTTAQAAARDDALRPLATAVREATVAAYNWVPR